MRTLPISSRVFVTGGCGFIGSNFINFLHEKYPDVFILNFDRIDYCSNPDHIQVNDSFRYVLVQGDINNSDLVIQTLKTYEIDHVVHFAAQSHVDNSFGNSLQFTHDNVLGTHALLESCRVYGNIKKFVHMSTDEVYGEVDLNEEDKTEKSLLNPTNPYAATKAAAEFIVKSYYHSYKLPSVIVRGNNVYGPNQYPEKIIPRFIKHLQEGKKCPVHGEGNTRRNFIYVDDVSSAMLLILEKGEINNVYNIGTVNEHSVMDILIMLAKKIKGKGKGDGHVDLTEVIEYVPDRLFNDKRYAISSDKLTKLGWKPVVDFDVGIDRTIEFMKIGKMYTYEGLL
jgi:dTDP-glucose 4,6-dehydratase